MSYKNLCLILIAIFYSFSITWAQTILEGDRSIPVEAKNGIVVTSHTLATEEALQVLKNGGNAIDAAVTAAFALAVKGEFKDA